MHYTWQTTEGPLRYPEDLQGHWSVLFYYGGDFTPVAATELLALSALWGEFDQAGAKIYAISPDSLPTHLAFSATLERYRLETQPAAPLSFPLAVDQESTLRKELLLNSQKKYIWLLSPEAESMAHFSYPADTGVNFTEILRTLLALQTERPTPHGWTPGTHTLLPPPQTQEERIAHMEKSEQQGGYCIDWYICFEGYRNDEPALPQ